ncbi:MAG: OmpA family protein [Myxococcales bacterium]|nr:OmpA family protein [Myxococcales bacterium]
MRIRHSFSLGQALLLTTLPSASALAQTSDGSPSVAASDDGSFVEKLQLHLEAGGDVVLGGTPSDRFDPGGHLRGQLSAPIAEELHLQVGTGSWWFPAASGEVGRLISAEAGLRFTPMMKAGPEGLFIEASGGIGLTGDLQRPVVSLGVGWQFPIGASLGLGPVLRYTQVFQPDSETGPDDARLLGAGLMFSLGIPRRNAEPPPDSDGDGLPDDRDRCPTATEDADGFQDDDGCPEPDNDADGILDADDRCPNAGETHNEYEDDDGCPDQAPPPQPEKLPEPVPGEGRAVPSTPMEQVVHFNYKSHRILGSEEAAIQAACDELNRNAGVRVRVRGHADEAGSPGYNHELSAERAGNVARWLVRCGVAGSRIVVQADGENFPLCRERTDACAARNRRVEFEMLEE